MQPQELIVQIQDTSNKQADIANLYAQAIFEHLGHWQNEWPEINRAIIERWSKSGLVRIKEMAWKGIKR